MTSFRQELSGVNVNRPDVRLEPGKAYLKLVSRKEHEAVLHVTFANREWSQFVGHPWEVRLYQYENRMPSLEDRYWDKKFVASLDSIEGTPVVKNLKIYGSLLGGSLEKGHWLTVSSDITASIFEEDRIFTFANSNVRPDQKPDQRPDRIAIFTASARVVNNVEYEKMSITLLLKPMPRDS